MLHEEVSGFDICPDWFWHCMCHDSVWHCNVSYHWGQEVLGSKDDCSESTEKGCGQIKTINICTPKED